MDTRQEPRLTLADIRPRATITTEEYADLMGVGRTTAYAAVRSGDIPTVGVGRRLLIPVPALLWTLGDLSV